MSLLTNRPEQTKRNDELRLKYSSFLLKGPCWPRKFVCASGGCCCNLLVLSLLCGLLGPALLCGLLGPTLFRCGLLTTFFSCHSFYCSFFPSLGFQVLTTRYCVYLCLVG